MTREEQIYEAADKATYQTPPQYSELVHKSRKVISAFEVGFIDGCVWADSHPNWISVEDKLPPENGKTQQSVSVWATNGLMSGEFRYNFDTKTWTDMWGDPFDITHWMNLPVPPRKEE